MRERVARDARGAIARPVLAREVSLSVEDVPRQDDAESLALESAGAPLDEPPEDRSGRRHDSDAVARTEARRRDQRGIPIGCGAVWAMCLLLASTVTSRSSASRAAATELRLPFVSIEKTTRSPPAAVT